MSKKREAYWAAWQRRRRSASVGVLVTINGLTSGNAVAGAHATTTMSVNNGTISARKWGSTSGGSEYGTGTSPTDFSAGEGGLLYATATVDGQDYTVSALIVYAAPVASGGVADQSYAQDSAISTLDVSSDFTGSGITYALAPSSASLPAGLSLASNGQITGTPTTEAAQVNIVVRGTNSGGFDDTAFGVTITAASSSVTTTFGADTLQGEGGIAVTGTSISSGDASGHWQIGAGLLSPSATGEGAITGTYNLTLNNGQTVAITIEATTKTVRTTAELSAAVSAWKSARVNGQKIALRPGDYEMHDGSNPYGFFRSINNAGSTDWLIIGSADTNNRARFYNTSNHTNSGANSVINAYLRFQDLDFYMTRAWGEANKRFFFEYTASNAEQYLEWLNCNFSGEAYTQAEYDDPNLFGPAYNSGDLGLPVCISASRAGNWKVEDCTFTHVYAGIMGLQLTGTCSFQRNVIDTFYFDAVRFTAPGDSWSLPGVKTIKDNVIGGGFAVNNEVTASSPHNDSFQIFNDTGDTNNRVEDMILTNNICWGSKHARATAVQTMLFQSSFKDCVIAENIFFPKSVAWGFLIEGAAAGDSIQFINNTGMYYGKTSPSTAWRHDGNVDRGNTTIYGMVLDGTEQHNTSTPWNLFRLNNSIGMGNWDQFSNSGNVDGEASALAYATPNAGSAVALANQGALTTAGAFRNAGYGPRDSMGAPTVLATGSEGELQFTRAAAPTKTEGGAITGYYLSYKKTSDADTAWTTVDIGMTSPYVLTGLEAGVEYQGRHVPYISGGIPGVVGGVAVGTPDGAATYTPNGVEATGTFYMRTTSYSSGTMGKAGTLSLWMNQDAVANEGGYVVELKSAAGSDRFRFDTWGTGILNVNAWNASNTLILARRTSAEPPGFRGGWSHVLMSWDLATTTFQLYVNDVAVTGFAISTTTDDAIGDAGRATIFDTYAGGQKYEGGLSSVFMDTVYRELSVAANRRLFIDAGGSPVDVSSLGTPHLLLTSDAATFATNNGSGGGFGTTGTGSIIDVTPPA